MASCLSGSGVTLHQQGPQHRGHFARFLQPHQDSIRDHAVRQDVGMGIVIQFLPRMLMVDPVE